MSATVYVKLTDELTVMGHEDGTVTIGETLRHRIEDFSLPPVLVPDPFVHIPRNLLGRPITILREIDDKHSLSPNGSQKVVKLTIVGPDDEPPEPAA